jgi:hypothetical protein
MIENPADTVAKANAATVVKMIMPPPSRRGVTGPVTGVTVTVGTGVTRLR